MPRQTQEPPELFQANVVFGRASRGLDHAAIQEVSKAQLHEPRGGRVGERETAGTGQQGREIKREMERDIDKERDMSNPRKHIKYST